MAMTIEELTNKLSSIEPDESMYAGIGTTEIPLLEQLLNHPEPWMAARAVFSLARLKDAQSVSALQKATQDGRPEVRVAIATAARILNPAEADVLLRDLLEDTNAGVRKFAIQSVTAANGQDIHMKLRNIGASDPVPIIREDVMQKLRNLGLDF